METTVLRRSTSFRLKTDLLLVLKQQAKECNTSLNKYVEHILYNAAYEEPNTITMQAIQEAKSGLRKENEVFDNVNGLMTFLKS